MLCNEVIKGTNSQKLKLKATKVATNQNTHIIKYSNINTLAHKKTHPEG